MLKIDFFRWLVGLESFGTHDNKDYEDILNLASDAGIIDCRDRDKLLIELERNKPVNIAD